MRERRVEWAKPKTGTGARQLGLASRLSVLCQGKEKRDERKGASDKNVECETMQILRRARGLVGLYPSTKYTLYFGCRVMRNVFVACMGSIRGAAGIVEGGGPSVGRNSSDGVGFEWKERRTEWCNE
jgi:hypothetical protein